MTSAPANAATRDDQPARDRRRRPSTITAIAPSAAPEDTPITAGSASGLRNSPWNSIPETPRAAPDEHGEGDPREPELEQDHLGRAIHAVRAGP